MASVLVVCYDTSTGKYLVQSAGASQIADGAITSAKIASGQVGDAHIYPGSIISAKIGANVIAAPHIANQGILSANIGANVIATPHIANQGILSASIGANVIATPHIANQGILSASIGQGAIGHTLLANFGIISGKYASGSITEQALASGISVDVAEILQEPNYRAAELISAYLAVQFIQSGYFGYAKAGDVSSMPAIGIAAANILSGQIGTFQRQGRVTNAGWNFSGYIGNLVFVGTSSEITRMVSNLQVSGRCVQRIGKTVSPDTVYIAPELTFVQVAQ